MDKVKIKRNKKKVVIEVETGFWADEDYVIPLVLAALLNDHADRTIGYCGLYDSLEDFQDDLYDLSSKFIGLNDSFDCSPFYGENGFKKEFRDEMLKADKEFDEKQEEEARKAFARLAKLLPALWI